MNLFVKNLTVIDSSYLCEKRGMVGDSWIVDVSLTGDLNEMSMILDFGKVKKIIKELIDEHVDHKLIVPASNPNIEYSETQPGYTKLGFLRGEQTLHLNCPNSAYCFIETSEIDNRALTAHIYQVLKQYLPNNVSDIDITLRHEDIKEHYYHYTHGLKKHDGNCQRIAHGHRSTLEIYVNDERDSKREEDFCERWKDIYLGSQEDKVSIASLGFIAQENLVSDDSHYAFMYSTSQGDYELIISKEVTEIIDTDTTVELLAQFIQKEVKKTLNSEDSLSVVAYEGVGKGAKVF
ncbi:6-carboxytetrahydropterin synthase [Vibrio sp. SCSIO 43132]|uniref:6-pyruvoyl trahydropterin synthase family protein n=1 Tax=Vibrio sp. SCSIO 43132 TaxID=2779363 RepID=UPI001CA97C87|nr:6-carboxytetrahydropterin synthase [Vibrio sp. SCSIO 43132]UAB68998.1 6-carboxytetrahydropterin synthase [Vibrio sp. SCSIO 43132]